MDCKWYEETLVMKDIFIILIGLMFSQVYIVYIHILNRIKLYTLSNTVSCSSIIHQSYNTKNNVFF